MSVRTHTPREVLKAFYEAKNKPWWAERLGKRVEKHLTDTLFQGKPIIDTPMSAAACEAVLEEALNVVRMPGEDPIDDMLRDMHPLDDRKVIVFGAGFGKPAGNA